MSIQISIFSLLCMTHKYIYGYFFGHFDILFANRGANNTQKMRVVSSRRFCDN